MQRILFLLTVGFLSLFSNVNAQQVFDKNTEYFLFGLHSSFIHDTSVGMSADVYFVKPSDNILSVGAKLHYFFNDELQPSVIPEVGVGYLFNFKDKGNPYKNFRSAPFYLARLNTSMDYLRPEVGITVLGLVNLTTSYNIVWDKKQKDLEGFGINLGFQVPLEIFQPNF